MPRLAVTSPSVLPLPALVRPAALLLAALLLAGPLTSGALGQTQPQQRHHPNKGEKRVRREQIEDLEQQWRQAQLKDDIPTMDSLLADDFLGTTASGQVVTKSQQLDRMRTHTVVISRLDLSDVKVKLIGQVAIVNSLAEIEGSADGNPLSGSFRYTRVYQRLPNGSWKITSFSATRVPHNLPQPATAQSTPPPSGR